MKKPLGDDALMAVTDASVAADNTAAAEAAAAEAAELERRERDARIFRLLPGIGKFVISNLSFNKLNPDEKTRVLEHAGAIPVLFVPSFQGLMDRKALRDKLLAGSDVGLELEFNGIELSGKEQAALGAVRPVLQRIAEVGRLAYQWLPPLEALPRRLRINSRSVSSNGYRVDLEYVRRIWDTASRFWALGSGQTSIQIYVRSYGYRDARISAEGVKVGCQSLSRAEVEFIANHFMWPPAEVKTKADN